MTDEGKNSCERDIFIFSHENILEQMKQSPLQMGYHVLEFYVDEQGVISREKTQRKEKFYLSPSGGTLRDKDMNIVTYLSLIHI